MNEYAFRQQIARLKGVFGDKAFQEARLEIIAKAIRSLPDSSFEKIVTHFISSFRQAPLPKDFLEAAAKERVPTHNPNGHYRGEPYKFKCDTCHEMTVLTVKENATGKEWFIRCFCQTVLKKSVWKELPIWSSELNSDFEILPWDEARGRMWKPKSFNPHDSTNSLRDMAELWKLKIKTSAIFWKEYRGEKT